MPTMSSEHLCLPRTVDLSIMTTMFSTCDRICFSVQGEALSPPNFRSRQLRLLTCALRETLPRPGAASYGDLMVDAPTVSESHSVQERRTIRPCALIPH